VENNDLKIEKKKMKNRRAFSIMVEHTMEYIKNNRVSNRITAKKKHVTAGAT